jgi:transcriptional regulator with XRE-family HTH domain
MSEPDSKITLREFHEYFAQSYEMPHAIAERIGVAKATIWDWFAGKSEPKAKSLMKLRRFLDAEAKRHFRATGLGRLNPYRTKSPGHFNKCATLGSARSAAKRGARSVR